MYQEESRVEQRLEDQDMLANLEVVQYAWKVKSKLGGKNKKKIKLSPQDAKLVDFFISI
jgi:hypothetical protein